MAEALTGKAYCNVCHSPCGTCGCRLGGCYTEAWWNEQLQPSDELLAAVRGAGIPPISQHEFDLATNRPLGPPPSWAAEWGEDDDYRPWPGN